MHAAVTSSFLATWIGLREVRDSSAWLRERAKAIEGGWDACIALSSPKHREIERVEVGGHSDITGPRPFNMRLSRDRARSVRQHLLSRGIPRAPERARLRAGQADPR